MTSWSPPSGSWRPRAHRMVSTAPQGRSQIKLAGEVVRQSQAHIPFQQGGEVSGRRRTEPPEKLTHTRMRGENTQEKKDVFLMSARPDSTGKQPVNRLHLQPRSGRRLPEGAAGNPLPGGVCPTAGSNPQGALEQRRGPEGLSLRRELAAGLPLRYGDCRAGQQV